MPKARPQGNPVPGPESRAAWKRDPASRGRAIHPGAELEYVRKQLRRMAELADAGLRMAAREAGADLLFEFQPVIVAHSELASQDIEVLRRCEATALRRRFVMAAYDDAIAIPVQLTRAADPPAITAGRNSPRLARKAAERQSPVPVLIADMAK